MNSFFKSFWFVVLALFQILTLIGILLVDCKLTKSAFFTTPCGKYVPSEENFYAVVAGRSKVVCVVKCSMDPGCLRVEFREPGKCLLSNSSVTMCTQTHLPAGSHFYIMIRCSEKEQRTLLNHTGMRETLLFTKETLCFSAQNPVEVSTTQDPSEARITQEPSEATTIQEPNEASTTQEQSESPTTQQLVHSTTTATCLEGWLSHRNSCYCFNDTTFTRPVAKLYCEGLSAHLLSLNDDEEKLFIENAIDPAPEFLSSHTCWTSGMLTSGFPGTYIWDDGSGKVMTLFDWFSGQPDFNGGLEFYVLLQYHFGSWGFNDVDGNTLHKVVCEYEL